MSFTYSGNPAESVLDAVRFEIADTNPTAPLLQDAEIVYAISQEAPGTEPSQGAVLAAAARCMETLARLFAAQADTELGSLKVTYSKQAKGYSERAVELRARAAGMHAPWSGGLLVAEKHQRQNEPGVVQPAFRRDEFDNPHADAPLSSGLLPEGER